MTTAATSAIGVAFKRGADSIGDIESIGWDGMTRDMIDTTTLDSTGGYKEFVEGLRDSGAITLAMNFVRDVFEDFRIDYETTLAQSYSIELADTGVTTLGITGLVQSLGINATKENVVKATVVIKVTGQWTLSS